MNRPRNRPRRRPRSFWRGRQPGVDYEDENEDEDDGGGRGARWMMPTPVDFRAHIGYPGIGPRPWSGAAMPANLSPETSAPTRPTARRRRTRSGIACLEEMLACIPKHKGTEKMQADLRRGIAKLARAPVRARRRAAAQRLPRRAGRRRPGGPARIAQLRQVRPRGQALQRESHRHRLSVRHPRPRARPLILMITHTLDFDVHPYSRFGSSYSTLDLDEKIIL